MGKKELIKFKINGNAVLGLISINKRFHVFTYEKRGSEPTREEIISQINGIHTPWNFAMTWAMEKDLAELAYKNVNSLTFRF